MLSVAHRASSYGIAANGVRGKMIERVAHFAAVIICGRRFVFSVVTLEKKKVTATKKSIIVVVAVWGN